MKLDEFPATYENWVDLIHPEDRASALSIAEEHLRTRPDLYENDFRLRTKSGEYRWIHTKAKIVERTKDGEPVLMIGNHEDITELKKNEEILRESEAFLRTLLHSIPIPVFYKDCDGSYLGFNKAFELFFGAKKKDLIGKSVFDINPPELAEKIPGER